MPYTPPTYKAEGFNCPLCNFYAQQFWHKVFHRNMKVDSGGLLVYDGLELSQCFKCYGKLLWYEEKNCVSYSNWCTSSSSRHA